MTYDEMIAVLQAAKEGKKIQFRKADNDTNIWEDTSMPNWNFLFSDYRVKPEPTFRPYANAEEFLADMKEHGPYLKEGIAYYLPVQVFDKYVYDSEDNLSYEQLLKEIVWQDGHPCGI